MMRDVQDSWLLHLSREVDVLKSRPLNNGSPLPPQEPPPIGWLRPLALALSLGVLTGHLTIEQAFRLFRSALGLPG